MREQLAEIHPALLYLTILAVATTAAWNGYQLAMALDLSANVWVLVGTTLYGLPLWFIALVLLALAWIWLGGGD